MFDTALWPQFGRFKDERRSPPPCNLLFPWLDCLPRRWSDWLFGAATVTSKGFSVCVHSEGTLKLQARERRHMRAFEEQSVRDVAMTTEARVAAIQEDLPALISVKKRCQTIEQQVDRLVQDGRLAATRKRKNRK